MKPNTITLRALLNNDIRGMHNFLNMFCTRDDLRKYARRCNVPEGRLKRDTVMNIVNSGYDIVVKVGVKL